MPTRFLRRAVWPNKGQSNLSRFDMPAWNALYDKAKMLSNSPERDQLFRKWISSFSPTPPVRPIAHRIVTGLTQPWVIGYRRNQVMREFWKYLDIDESALPSRARSSRRGGSKPLRDGTRS